MNKYYWTIHGMEVTDNPPLNTHGEEQNAYYRAEDIESLVSGWQQRLDGIYKRVKDTNETIKKKLLMRG